MARDFGTRGYAFNKVVRRIAPAERRVGDDLLLFDEYTITSLMLKPLRTQYTVAVNVLEGKGRAMVNSVVYDFEAPCLLVFVPGQVFSLTDAPEAPIKSRVMLLSETFMNDFYGMSFRMNEVFATLLINPVIGLDGNGCAYVDSFVRSCILTISDTENPRRYDVVKHLTIALFYGAIIGICNRNIVNNGNRTSEICAAFFSELKASFREEHRLEYYASVLCMTSRYLFVCVKSVTGKSPRYWIEFYVLSEAKRLLKETDWTIDRISDTLGFGSQSVFGKFFKRLSGFSPLEYRNGRN